MEISIEELFDKAEPEQLESLLAGVEAKRAKAGEKRRVIARVTGEKKKRSPKIWIAAAAAVALIAAAFLGVAIFTRRPVIPAQPQNNSVEMIKRLECFDRIIWSDSDADDPHIERAPDGPVLWNGVYVDERLYAALESASDEDVFAVMLRSKLGALEFEDFVFEGKTGAELIEEEQEINEVVRELEIFDYISGGSLDTVDPTMMWEWLKAEGAFEESIKPDCIERFGQEFLDRYWSEEGGFDRAAILRDKEEQKKLKQAAHERSFAAGAEFGFEKCETAIISLYYSGAADYYYIGNYHDGEDGGRSYYIAIVTKAQLASAAKMIKGRGLDSRFDFENACFTMVKYPASEMDGAVIGFLRAAAKGLPLNDVRAFIPGNAEVVAFDEAAIARIAGR
ncbi:MAG: hypothetical protein J5586_04145 [Clostridia bacterium]|nr:hypothetical protein [Clostridia bacterium]